jgi:hypothetical protein
MGTIIETTKTTDMSPNSIEELYQQNGPETYTTGVSSALAFSSPVDDGPAVVVAVSDRQQQRQEQTVPKRHVMFGKIYLRTYAMTIGSNPSVSIGAPVTMEWEYTECPPVSVDSYEKKRIHHRQQPLGTFHLSYYQRRDLLTRAGFTERQVKDAEREAQQIQFQRKMSYCLCYHKVFVDRIHFTIGQRKVRQYLKRYNKSRNQGTKQKKEGEGVATQ